MSTFYLNKEIQTAFTQSTSLLHNFQVWRIQYYRQICFVSYSIIYPTRCNVTQFTLSGNCSTCFVWYHYPSSGAQTTVSTEFGICHTVTATCRYWNRLECAVGGVRQPQHTQTGSNSSTIAADGSNGVTNTRCCRCSCMRS